MTAPEPAPAPAAAAAGEDGFAPLEADTLRFTTCGSVDDGKSTLIGRLLYDAQTVFTDHLDSARRLTQSADVRAAGEEIDFSLLVDGLKAEREQGITIDVAYRYFSTPRRKFIIADTPGHEQYTRNMATGASTADLALLLVDARAGVITQTKRHAFISSLLGIRHCVLCVNKMDLVGYDQAVFERIRREFTDFAARLEIPDLEFVPLSALKGDNIVARSERMPWYRGLPLLELLESIHVASDRNLIDLRFPVQGVTRVNDEARKLEFRGYTGQLASGVLRAGDEVLVLPSRRRSRVARIVTYDGDLEQAFAPQSITVTLADELDVSRGDVLCHPHNQPRVARHVEAMLVWMHEEPLQEGGRYLVKHQTQTAPVTVEALRYVVDVNTLSRRVDQPQLGLNGVGRVVLAAHRPLLYDPYRKNRATGSLILIDPVTNVTVAAGMLLDRAPSEVLPTRIREWQDEDEEPTPEPDAGLPKAPRRLTRAERGARLRQRPGTVWLTGLPASGAREVALAVERLLFERGHLAHVLDGAALRRGLSQELDFSQADMGEHLRRASAVARLFNDAGLLALCSFVSPLASIRRRAREAVGASSFLEVHVASPLAWCEARDPRGVYRRARAGELLNVPGVNGPYEEPEAPDLVVRPDAEGGIEAAAAAVVALLEARGFLTPEGGSAPAAGAGGA